MENYELFKSILTTIPEDARSVSFTGFALLMLISIVMSILVSHLYTIFYDSNSTGSRIHRSFPLVGPAVTAIFITVQFSLPLSLGLLGALSIVRFRTPIKEPEEIGFILLVVACSITIATFNVAFAILLYLCVLAVLFLIRTFPGIGGFQREASVLNVIVSKPEGSTLDEAMLVSQKLDEYRVKHVVSSVHVDEDRANISIVIQKHKHMDPSIINRLVQEFPELRIDYYRRS